jgi:signal peptidase I
MSPRARPGVRARTAATAVVSFAAAAVGAWVLVQLASRALRRVRGSSMAPTLRAGEVLLVRRPRAAPRVGEVVVVRDPRDHHRETVKRVAATAGQLADLGGAVARVPPGHVAVRGDAPLASTDSRRFGPVPLETVTARVVARVWPPPVRLL